jgi:hypothetical protein
VAEVVDRFLDAGAGLGPEPYRAAAMEVALQNFAVEHVPCIAEDHFRARLKLLTRMYERVPFLIFEITEKQAFNRAAARNARAEQTGRKHFRIVDDEEIALTDVLDQTGHAGVFYGGGTSMENKQPGCGAIGCRGLRDELRR